MRLAIRLTVLFVALFLAAPATDAQTIDTVSPPAGTVGTVVTLAGSGFGSIKPRPKLWLTQDGSSKKLKLKVLSVSDVELVGEVRKATPGTFDVHVQLKGKGQPVVTAEDAFDVDLPEITSVDPDPVVAGQAATLGGALFGTRKPKVKIGGKKGKVTLFGDDTIQVVPHKKLPNGLYSIELKNKVGTTVAPYALVLSGSSVNRGTLGEAEAKVNGKKFAAAGLFAVLAVVQDGATTITMASTGFPQRQVVITLPFDPDLDEAPVAFDGTDGGSVAYSETEALFGLPTIWTSAEQGDDYLVVIQERDGDVVTITFEANLVRTQGSAGKATAVITKGVVKAELP